MWRSSRARRPPTKSCGFLSPPTRPRGAYGPTSRSAHRGVLDDLFETGYSVRAESLLRFTRRASIAALLAMLFGAGSALAQKSLHWRALDVKARLDADGSLHVVERHAMVFTGDWNGGERSFRLFPGQRL